jgi:hypothetical protein
MTDHLSRLRDRVRLNAVGVALYRYALDGEAVGGFTPAELESAVHRRGGTAPSTI